MLLQTGSTEFVKNDRQVLAIRLMAASLHTMLYGGSRSGKTFIIIYGIIVRACKVKSRHAILRRAFNHAKVSIWRDTLPKVLDICFPNLSVEWNAVDYYIELPNGAQIWIGGLDDKQRVEKILGNEYSTIYLNECSLITWIAVCIVITRLAEKSGLQPRMFYDCNPPSKKHWTYQVFEKGLDPETREPLATQNHASMQINPSDNTRNQAPGYIEQILGALPRRQRARFEDGLYSDDIEGALWDVNMIDVARALTGQWKKYRSVVGVDPATTNNPNSDEHGIMVASAYTDRTYSVDADYTLKGRPQAWADTAIYAYQEHDADAIVIETNQGGDMCESTLRNAGYDGRIIRVHAKQSKYIRAEPVSALYEQGRVGHAEGLEQYEDEITTWVPMPGAESPNRLDAGVYAIKELSEGTHAGVFGR